MKATRLQEQCPKCGSRLMIKEGEHGDFLACPKFPACKFTKPLPDGDLKIYQKPSPYCGKCEHTGLIPFKNKEGKVIPHTHLFCECNPQGYSNSYPYQYTPEMFDFPLSYSCYRSLCQQHGWADPGDDRAPEISEPIETKVELVRYVSYQNVDGKQLSLLRKNLIQHIDEKLNERLDASKKKKGKYD